MPQTGHGAGYSKKASQAHPGSNPQPLAGWCWEFFTPQGYHFYKMGTLIPAFSGILISNNDWTEVSESTEGAEHVPLNAWPLVHTPFPSRFLTPFLQQTFKWASLCQAPHPTLGGSEKSETGTFSAPLELTICILQFFPTPGPPIWPGFIRFLFIGALPLFNNFNAHLGEASAGVF